MIEYRLQKLVDICFSLAIMVHCNDRFCKRDSEGVARYVADQLRQCGYPTHPVGMSWGVLEPDNSTNSKAVLSLPEHHGAHMTRDQADYALVHVKRALAMLEVAIETDSPFTGVEVGHELRRALEHVADQKINVRWGPAREPDIYNDTIIRPGLNRTTEDAANG